MAARSPSREKDPWPWTPGLWYAGGGNRASCGPTAGRGDHRSSPAPPNRRFQQPSAGSLHSQAKYARHGFFPEKPLPQSFLGQAFSENSKGFVVVFKIRSKELQGPRSWRTAMQVGCSHPPLSAPHPAPLPYELKDARCCGRASKRGIRAARRCFPPSQPRRRQEPETASAAAATGLSLPAAARSTWKKRPKVRFHHLQRLP